MIKISVIVATRNRYQKLKRAIRSIEKQSLKDFEIIIVNDASTDETYDFLESIKNRNILLNYICLFDYLFISS